MIKYEDYVNGANPDIKDYSNEALYERGKFLVEVIDKSKTVLNHKKLSSMIRKNTNKNNKSRLVISSAPGSGKTTAMRQYIVNNVKTTGTVSMNRIDDIEKFYYDVIANIKYSLKEPKPGEIDYRYETITGFKKYVLYDSHNNTKSDNELRHSNWIFCTHQRLLTDPELLLYVRVEGGEILQYQEARDVLLIDELPSLMFNKISFDSLANMLSINSIIADVLKLAPGDVTNKQRYEFVRDKISNKLFSDAIMKLIGKIPRNGKELPLSDVMYTKNKAYAEKSIVKVLEILNYCINYNTAYTHKIYSKIYELNKNRSANDQLSYSYKPYTTYYSILKFNVKNIIIFDGTADILLKNSGWNLIGIDNKRNLDINNVVKIDSKVDRTEDSLENIIESFSNVIEQINDKYHGTKNLLIYTWKNKKFGSEFKDTNEEEPEILGDLKESLDKKGIKNYNIVTYKSGKEKSTNEYIKSDVVIVLGKFFIPSIAIDDFNRANGIKRDCSITPKDYTLALLIQLLYRTRARSTGKSIDLYIDSQYSDEFIQRLIDLAGSLAKVSKEIISSNYSKKLNRDRIRLQLSKIGMKENDSEKIFSMDELKSIFGIEKSHRSAKMLLKLVTDDGLLKSKIIQKGTRTKNVNTLVKITNPLVSESEK